MPFEMPTAPPPGATRVEGRAGGRPEIDKPLKLRPNHDFYLMHHAGNGWRLEETDRGWEVLPVLKDLVKVGGVNGVELTQQGPNTQLARARLRDAGWTVLEDQDAYRSLFDVAGGTAHLLLWDVVDRFPDGEVNVSFDHKGWADFRRALVERDVIKPPRPKIIAQLRRRLQRRMGRREPHLDIPSRHAAQERDKEAIVGLDQALGKRVPEAEPPVKRERIQGRRTGAVKEPSLDAPPAGDPPASAKAGGAGTPT